MKRTFVTPGATSEIPGNHVRCTLPSMTHEIGLCSILSISLAPWATSASGGIREIGKGRFMYETENLETLSSHEYRILEREIVLSNAHPSHPVSLASSNRGRYWPR